MAPSSRRGDEPPTSSPVANSTPLVSREAQMFVATGHANCQQLKDMLIREDSSSMVVVMASSRLTSTPDPPSPPPVMDPGLLAVCCSGSWKKLQSFLNEDPRPTCNNLTIRCCCCSWKKRQSFPPEEPRPSSSDGTTGGCAVQQPPRDHEALLRVSFLDGVTVDGDTFLHVMATNSVVGDLIEDGLGLIIRKKAEQFLSKQNNNGDTPLHCAARAAKPGMVSFLVDLARANDANTLKALLEKENKRGWTVLHEAVRIGDNDTVKFLLAEYPELASFPKDGTSPLYLAILLREYGIVKTLYKKSGGVLSYSGPNGQNALHAAVLRHTDLTEKLLIWNETLTIQQDENGSTPLHFAASVQNIKFGRRVCWLLLKANPNALYQQDQNGSFPIHVAASFSVTRVITDFLNNSPNCAGLRDAKGRTFLHVAVEKKKRGIVYHACRNQSLSWILNMQDLNGNTALHLAIQAGSFRMFCNLLGNREVQLDLINEKGETPLDIANTNCAKAGLQMTQSSEGKIRFGLKTCCANTGYCRQDYVKEKDIVQVKQIQIDNIETVKNMTQNLCIGSALIATVTFGATFAMPGGYRADDHPNGGTPTLAGRYPFDAFTLANALAFTLSAMATISLMISGSPLHDHHSRLYNLSAANYLMLISIKCLVVAFAIGTYMVLAPVSHKTAVAACVLSSFVLFYQHLEMLIKQHLLVVPFSVRRGIIFTCTWYVKFTMYVIIVEHWPMIVIFCSTLRNYPAGKVEPPVLPPTLSP